jgi:membrane-associated phospholipid phosphatase
MITEESSAPGERHFVLRHFVGELAVRGWPGEPGDRLREHTPVQWMRAVEWIPYQRRTFVSPAFPGFVSGHSTFSRAAAEALTALTGSPFFPGGMFEFVARADAYLVFENGPSTDVRLQWATYQDAADQAGQSRLFGGIHIFADDRAGRIVGEAAGLGAAARARELFEGR